MNGDGYLTTEELKEGLKAKKIENPKEEEEVKKLFQAADTNGDGQVSLSEYLHLFRKQKKIFVD